MSQEYKNDDFDENIESSTYLDSVLPEFNENLELLSKKYGVIHLLDRGRSVYLIGIKPTNENIDLKSINISNITKDTNTNRIKTLKKKDLLKDDFIEIKPLLGLSEKKSIPTRDEIRKILSIIFSGHIENINTPTTGNNGTVVIELCNIRAQNILQESRPPLNGSLDSPRNVSFSPQFVRRRRRASSRASTLWETVVGTSDSDSSLQNDEVEDWDKNFAIKTYTWLHSISAPPFKRRHLLETLVSGQGEIGFRYLMGLISLRCSSIRKGIPIPPGQEFAISSDFAEGRGSVLMLGDRDIRVSLARLWKVLSFGGKIRLLWAISTMDVSPKSVCKYMNLLGETDMLLAIIRTALPDILYKPVNEVINVERAKFIVSSLRRAPGPFVIGVVSHSNIPLIQKMWNEPINRRELQIAAPFAHRSLYSAISVHNPLSPTSLFIILIFSCLAFASVYYWYVFYRVIR